MPDRVNLILDGLQRCLALIAVFSEEEIVVSDKFKGIKLYYNLFKDIFMFKEEIKEKLDYPWINLKETHDPIIHSSVLLERFMRRNEIFLSEIEGLEDRKLICERIKWVFKLTNQMFRYSQYDGNDVSIASDLVFYRNLCKFKKLENVDFFII